MVKVISEPENLREIKLAFDIKLAEMGISQADFALKECKEKPYILTNILTGKTKPDKIRHAHIIKPVSKLTNAPSFAWNN